MIMNNPSLALFSNLKTITVSFVQQIDNFVALFTWVPLLPILSTFFSNSSTSVSSLSLSDLYRLTFLSLRAVITETSFIYSCTLWQKDKNNPNLIFETLWLKHFIIRLFYCHIDSHLHFLIIKCFISVLLVISINLIKHNCVFLVLICFCFIERGKGCVE